MKNRYRLFRRGRVFYAREVETGKNESLKTKERSVAERLLHAKNEASRQPQVNLAMARAYLAAADPLMSHRTWNEVMEEYRRTGKEATQEPNQSINPSPTLGPNGRVVGLDVHPVCRRHCSRTRSAQSAPHRPADIDAARGVAPSPAHPPFHRSLLCSFAATPCLLSRKSLAHRPVSAPVHRFIAVRLGWLHHLASGTRRLGGG
jgi:hypothetical protein